MQSQLPVAAQMGYMDHKSAKKQHLPVRAKNTFRSRKVAGRVASVGHTNGVMGAAPLLKVGQEVIIRPGDPGFTSVQLPPRDKVSYWAVLWNEFLGTLMYALAGRLFVAFFGGTTFAATIPTLFGTALSNGLAFMSAMAVFGGVSGGHFNPAITLCVFILEVFTHFGLMGKFKWQGIEAGIDEAGEDLMGEITNGDNGNEKTSRPWKSWLGLLPYFLVQFVAFLLAALLIWGFLPPSQNPRQAPVALGIPFVTGNVDNGRTFGVEIAGSFLFLVAYMLLLKMFGSDRSWFIQVIRSLAFGLWYFALILVFAPWAGAVWNPTLWLAFALISGRYSDWWVLLIPAFISSVATSLFCVAHWYISKPNIFKELTAMGKDQHKRVSRGVKSTIRRYR